jgi:hypothetical protein
MIFTGLFIIHQIDIAFVILNDPDDITEIDTPVWNKGKIERNIKTSAKA